MSSRKRSRKSGAWDCSVCTYKNERDSFKCAMCNVRKGTSTRKPRLNSTVVEQQVIVQQFVQQQQQQIPKALGLNEEGATTDEYDSSVDHSDTDDADSYVQPSTSASAIIIPPKTNPNPSNASTSPPSTPRVRSASPPLCSDINATTPTQSVTSSVPAECPESSSKAPSNATVTPPKPAKKPRRKSSNTRAVVQKAIQLGAPLRNLDRNSACTLAVTVDDVTVVITDYKVKPRKPRTPKVKPPPVMALDTVDNDGEVKDVNGVPMPMLNIVTEPEVVDSDIDKPVESVVAGVVADEEFPKEVIADDKLDELM